MGFWSWLTGGGEAVESAAKVAEKATDGIYNGIDKMFYTDEEKAENAQKILDSQLAFIRMAYNSNSIRSVARRVIAFAFTANFLLILDVALFFAVRGDANIVKSIVDVCTAFRVGIIQLAIVGFYFGVHMLRSWKK